MKSVCHISHGDDLFEVVFHGHVISRITRYHQGGSHCTSMVFDDLPDVVKDRILDKVEDILTENEPTPPNYTI